MLFRSVTQANPPNALVDLNFSGAKYPSFFECRDQGQGWENPKTGQVMLSTRQVSGDVELSPQAFRPPRALGQPHKQISSISTTTPQRAHPTQRETSVKIELHHCIAQGTLLDTL